jgi:Leucine-rich repeat (LRR) protein
LNLSYNNFSNQLILRTDIELVSCDCLDPLVFLGNHLVLDLSHNQFKTVTTGYALDKFLFRGPTAVLFNGNPIEHINIISTPAIHTKTLGLLVNEIAKSSTSDITFLRFKAITNIYLGDVDREKNGIMPFDLKYMPKLIQLDLSVLQMTRLPANLHVLTELEYFHMNFNKVRTLKRSDISSLLKLDRFQIAKNDLEDVEDDVFDDLHHLKSIQLDGNVKLQKVPSSVAKSTVTWLGLDELPLLGDEGMLTDQEFNQMTNLDRLGMFHYIYFYYVISFYHTACSPFLLTTLHYRNMQYRYYKISKNN